MIPLGASHKTQAGDPWWEKVSLLLPMTGANGGTTFTDESNTGTAFTAGGNAQTSTAQFKWSDSSGLFDGNGDYLSAASNAVFDMGTGNFTLEAWVRPIALTNLYGSIISSNHGSWASGSVAFNFGENSKFRLSCFLFSASIESTATLSLDTWQHLAVERVGNVFTLYKDGVACGTGTQTAAVNFASSTAVRIGGNTWDGANGYANAYIQDVRLTKGIPRRRGNFDPPAAAFLTY